MDEFLDKIQSMIESYYDLNPQLSVSKLKIDHKDAKDLYAQAGRAGLILEKDSDGFLNMGIFFNPQIIKKLETVKVDNKVDSGELDSIWVTIEETSHYLLLMERLQKKWPISPFELEFQAEIDKILISSILFGKPTELDYLDTLIYHSFDRSKITSNDPIYKKASKLAEKFWRKQVRNGLGKLYGIECHKFRNFMRIFYREHISTKLI